MKKFIFPLLFVLFTIWQLSSLLKPEWPTSHDGIYHLIRIREYFYELKQGQFPVRWTNRLDNGYGLPLFNYIYPGPYLFSSFFLALGFSEVNTYKAIILLFYFLGTFGIYYLFRHQNKFLALIAGLLYGLSPYYFLDIFVRGAFGEVVALGLIPWVFHGFNRQKKLFSAFVLALLLISHNLLGLLFLPILAVYLFSYRLLSRQSLVGLSLAFGLSAFFLFPAILEKNLISSGSENSYTFNYSEHFLYLPQLIYSKWDYWYSLPGPNDGISFQLGFSNFLLFLVGLLGFILSKKNKILLFLSVAVFSLFLTLNYSHYLWKLISPLQIIQFPWRFLFVPVIISPLLFIELSTVIPKKFYYFFALFLLFLALYNTRNYRRPLTFYQLNSDQFQEIIQLNYQKTTTTSRHEVTPMWSQKEKSFGSQVIDSRTNEKINDITNESSFSISQKTPVIIRKNYFPGWQLIKVPENKPVDISPDSEGNISATLESGQYHLSYTGTFLEKITNLISLVSLLVLCYGIIKPCQK